MLCFSSLLSSSCFILNLKLQNGNANHVHAFFKHLLWLCFPSVNYFLGKGEEYIVGLLVGIRQYKKTLLLVFHSPFYICLVSVHRVQFYNRTSSVWGIGRYNLLLASTPGTRFKGGNWLNNERTRVVINALFEHVSTPLVWSQDTQPIRNNMASQITHWYYIPIILHYNSCHSLYVCNLLTQAKYFRFQVSSNARSSSINAGFLMFFFRSHISQASQIYLVWGCTSRKA